MMEVESSEEKTFRSNGKGKRSHCSRKKLNTPTITRVRGMNSSAGDGVWVEFAEQAKE
jgi:hypothetical protein